MTGAGRPRSPRKLPVYVLPVRIQQGWGDVREMEQACRAIARWAPGVELVELTAPKRDGRPDPRAEYVAPSHAGAARFPRMKRWSRPKGGGPAIVLATWLGTTGRRHDAEGGPLPGTLEAAIRSVQASHGASRTLLVSLEEFASDQSSYEAMDEGLRQAGWDPGRRERQLGSDVGRNEIARYHRAFELARGGEVPTLLHVVATFSPATEATREFPFLLSVGPYAAPRTRRSPPRRPGAKRDPTVVWYAGPPSSPAFAAILFPALASLGTKVELSVRASPEVARELPPPPDPHLLVRLVGPQTPTAWRRRWDGADLRIASGSQSLVEAVELRRPFLYFNGLLRGPGEAPRGFRREKLLSLLRGLERAGCPSQVLQDLEAFADGREVAEVSSRALRSAPWRAALVAGLSRLPGTFPGDRRDGGRFLAKVVERFGAYPGTAEAFVASVRAEAVP